MIVEISSSARETVTCVLLIGIFILTQGSCRSTQIPASNNPTQELAVLKTPPFSTKEPARYQAVRTVTSSGNQTGEAVVTKTLIARDENMRREEYEIHGGQKVVFLEIPQGKFVLLPAAKLFADMTESTVGGAVSSTGELSADFLLNQTPTETRYERLGPEAINGRSAIKYRVLTRPADADKTPDMQTFIWIDDQLGLPLRWETTPNSGSSGVASKMELSDITFDLDPTLFQLPPSYRKVALNAIYRQNGASDAVQKSRPPAK